MRSVLALLLVASFPSIACDPPPPIKTSSGERIASVSFEETAPLTTDTRETTFRGDRLRRAVALMDKHGVFGIEGRYEATGVVDKSTLTMTIKGVDGRERVIVAKNCGQEQLCAFFADAVKEGVIEKLPPICRDPAPCTKK